MRSSVFSGLWALGMLIAAQSETKRDSSMMKIDMVWARNISLKAKLKVSNRIQGGNNIYLSRRRYC